MPVSASASSRVEHCLDVVAVGIEHEAGIIGLAVTWTWAGRAIVHGARLERRTMEGLHLCLAADAESDMQGG